jgi:hypothetical protein
VFTASGAASGRRSGVFLADRGGAGGDGLAGDVAEAGEAEVDGGGAAGHLVELSQFLPGAGEADFKSLGFAGPAFAFGFGDALGQAGADVGDAVPLRATGRAGGQRRSR